MDGIVSIVILMTAAIVLSAISSWYIIKLHTLERTVDEIKCELSNQIKMIDDLIEILGCDDE